MLAGLALLVARAGPAWANPAAYEPGVDPTVGVNLISWSDFGDDGAAIWEAAVQDVYDHGFRAVTVCPVRFVNLVSGEVRRTDGVTSGPRAEHIAAAIRKAKSLGMTVSVTPFVEPDGFQIWRGLMNFSGAARTRFWLDYIAYLAEMAELAQCAGADRLYVGTELRALVRDAAHNAEWRALVDAVDAVFTGALGYAANWDAYRDPNLTAVLWEHPGIDVLGIDLYAPLATAAEASGPGHPSVSLLETSWDRVLTDTSGDPVHGILAFAAGRKGGTGLPVVIAEHGTIPYDTTTVQPSTDISAESAPDPIEQRNDYEALLRAVDHRRAAPPAAGQLFEVAFWHWRMPGTEGSAWLLHPEGADVATGRQAATFLVDFLATAPPETAPGKVLGSCRRAILAEFVRFLGAIAAVRQRCESRRLRERGAVSDCASDPVTLQRLQRARVKLATRIAKRCGGVDRVCGEDTTGEVGGAMLAWPATCPNIEGGTCSAPVGDVACSGLAACLACLGETALGQIAARAYGGDVPASGARQVFRCRRTIGGETVRLAVNRLNTLARCWRARLDGKHTSRCPSPCSGRHPGGRAAQAIERAEVRMIGRVCRACGGKDRRCDGTIGGVQGSAGHDDLTPGDLGLDEPCPGVVVAGGQGCPSAPATSLAEMVECLRCAAAFKSDCLSLPLVPQFVAYPAACTEAGSSTPSVPGSPEPTPMTPVPSITASPAPPPLASATGTETPTQSTTASATPTPTPTPVPSPSTTPTATHTPMATATSSPTRTPTPAPLPSATATPDVVLLAPDDGAAVCLTGVGFQGEIRHPAPGAKVCFDILTDKGDNPCDGGVENVFRAGDAPSRLVSLDPAFYTNAHFQWAIRWTTCADPAATCDLIDPPRKTSVPLPCKGIAVCREIRNLHTIACGG